MSSSDRNVKSLNEIESALISIQLSERKFISNGWDKDGDFDAWCRYMLHGDDARGRWYDKAMSVVVDAGGRVAVNAEHSPSDGLHATTVFNWSLRNNVDLNAGRTVSDEQLPVPEQLPFDIDTEMSKRIKQANGRILQKIQDSELVTLYHMDYGNDWIKKHAKMSPDGFTQMAIQLTYYRLYRKFVAAYQSAATRKYCKGRTDVTRVTSIESRRWCEIMESTTSTVYFVMAILIKVT